MVITKQSLLRLSIVLLLVLPIAACNSAALSVPGTATLYQTARSALQPYSTRLPPTQRVGPTVTASGPLLSTTRDDVKALMLPAPKTIGSFPVILSTQQSWDIPVAFTVSASQGTDLTVELFFYPSADVAYRGFQLYSSGLKESQQIAIGDNAIVTSVGPSFLGVLQYRNVLVRIENPSLDRDQQLPTVQPLTDEQLAAILKDTYEQILKGH